ncbi:unnamed protein product [Prunus brigantina]
MTSEAPESTSPVTITETEPTVRNPTSEPTITDRTAESVQEQAVVEDLMDKQAYRIETSFRAAMDRFSSEFRTLFQERMPASASMTPPGAGQRSQEGERLEPYGEGSSHGTPTRAPTSGYGQNFQPPTNGWGQSQLTWANSGPARLSEMTYSPLHALAVTLGQNTPMNSTAQHGGPVHTLAVHTHPGTSHPPAVSSQQYGQSNPIISSLLTPPFPPDSHPHFAQQQRPQNDGQQNQRQTAAQTEAPARGLRFEDVRRMIEDGLAQRRPEAPRYTKPDWSDMERTFHEHFYQTNREMTVAELARMSQAADESPRDYLQRFKTCRNWCRTSLPEREFVKMAEEGLEFEYRKKFQGIEFRDMHDLINKVERYASLLREEMQKKTASKGTYYRNPVVSYTEADGPTEAENDDIDISSAEVNIDKPFICKGLVKIDNSRTKIPDAKFATREAKAYTFDLTRAEAIFDLLLTEKKVNIITLGHIIPTTVLSCGTSYKN